jgi:uncharacterized protein
MSFALLDASVLVALFDPREAMRKRYTDKLVLCAKQRRRLLTTWPCVTEASYLLSPRSHLAMLAWLTEGGADVSNFEAADLPEFMDAMRKYTEPRKSLMDLADASLYWLAIKVDCVSILTEDRRDFLRYRLPDGRAFEIL